MRWMDAIVRISRAGSGQVGQEPSHSTQHHSLGQRIPSSFDKVTQPLSLNMDGAVTNWTRGIKVLSFQLTAVISFKQEDSQDSTPFPLRQTLQDLLCLERAKGSAAIWSIRHSARAPHQDFLRLTLNQQAGMQFEQGTIFKELFVLHQYKIYDCSGLWSPFQDSWWWPPLYQRTRDDWGGVQANSCKPQALTLGQSGTIPTPASQKTGAVPLSQTLVQSLGIWILIDKAAKF